MVGPWWAGAISVTATSGLPGAPYHFIDADLVIQGPICADLVKGFLSYWRGRWSHVGHHLSWFRIPTAIAENNNEFLLTLLEPEVALLFGLGQHLLDEALLGLQCGSGDGADGGGSASQGVAPALAPFGGDPGPAGPDDPDRPLAAGGHPLSGADLMPHSPPPGGG